MRNIDHNCSSAVKAAGIGCDSNLDLCQSMGTQNSRSHKYCRVSFYVASFSVVSRSSFSMFPSFGAFLNVLLPNAFVLQVTLNVYELASAAGFTCDIDPALVSAIASMRTGTLQFKDAAMSFTYFVHSYFDLRCIFGVCGGKCESFFFYLL